MKALLSIALLVCLSSVSSAQCNGGVCNLVTAPIRIPVQVVANTTAAVVRVPVCVYQNRIEPRRPFFPRLFGGRFSR